jgi:hypothetical protein
MCRRVERLIYCHPSNGPTFGLCDLFVADGCNANSNSYADFSSTYNRKGISKIVKSLQSFIDFSGATTDHKFRVLEYEVFRVLFQ